MMHPGLALQAALLAHLSADFTLLTLLDGAAIHDDVPKGADLPYLTFGNAVHFEWDTGTEGGKEHSITINVWSDHEGRLEVLEIAQAIEEAIRTVPEDLTDHALINLTHESTEVSKEIKTNLFLARVNLRAVTEPSTNI